MARNRAGNQGGSSDVSSPINYPTTRWSSPMARGLILWLFGVPFGVIALLYLFGFLS